MPEQNIIPLSGTLNFVKKKKSEIKREWMVGGNEESKDEAKSEWLKRKSIH